MTKCVSPPSYYRPLSSLVSPASPALPSLFKYLPPFLSRTTTGKKACWNRRLPAVPIGPYSYADTPAPIKTNMKRNRLRLPNSIDISRVLVKPFPFAWLILICLCYLNGSDAVQCFCTAKDCKDPLCESHWCLVGFKNDVDLVQTCATETAKALLKCARKLNEWTEVCSCTEDYCNTFSYMRETLKTYDEIHNGNSEITNELKELDTDNLEDKDARKGKKTSRNKHLIVLLVVVPLGIGAVTVCLVFLNYHCKMC